jgi:acyl dehydratase
MAEATQTFDYQRANPGDEWPSLQMPPVTRLTLALYCGASGDHNPLHVDSDFAREAGVGDVIAHGMLAMAYMGRTLTRHVPQTALREFNSRFLAMTRVGDAITCTASVIDRLTADDGTPCLRISVTASDQRGEVKAAGEATLALDAS